MPPLLAESRPTAHKYRSVLFQLPNKYEVMYHPANDTTTIVATGQVTNGSRNGRIY